MTNWVLVTSAKNFGVCHARGLWGDVEHHRISQLKPGDRVVLYVRGNQGEERYSLPGTGGRPKGRQLGGVARVVGSVCTTSEQIWPDRVYPYVVEIEWLTPYPPGAYINLRADASDLSASQGDFMLPTSSSNMDRWYTKLKKPAW
jgi:hypothetical protein